MGGLVPGPYKTLRVFMEHQTLLRTGYRIMYFQQGLDLRVFQRNHGTEPALGPESRMAIF